LVSAPEIRDTIFEAIAAVTTVESIAYICVAGFHAIHLKFI